MTAVVMLVGGFAVASLLWPALAAPFANPVLRRENYRGASLPTAAGVVALLAYVTVTALAGVVEALGWVDDPVGALSRSLVLPVVLGFGLLGLFDDLAGSGHHRGFGGHLAELTHGRLTTGMVKLLGGALVALAAVAAIPRGPQPWWLVLDAALVALAANLANLLDRAPGRTTKSAAIAFVALAAATATSRWSELAGPALALGAAAGLLRPELRERAMVGDTGANALGAALGMGVVLAISRPWRLVVLAALLGLNLASERVSFSRVIDAVRPLRWFDRLGSRRL